MTRTVVFDPATIGKALRALGAGRPWIPMSDQSPSSMIQADFLRWYERNSSAVEALRDLVVKVDDKAGPLNSFLQEHGFKPMFREISPGGVGACAILDMLVEWAVPALSTSVNVWDFNRRTLRKCAAFEVPKSGIEVFEADGYELPLVKINTKDGGAVWLVMCDQPAYPIGMLETAQQLMANARPIVAKKAYYISGVVVPTLEIDQEVDMSWILGARSGGQIIDQAFQVLKLRMNETGARVKATSGLGTMRGGPRMPQPLTFNEPFLGWFTQPENTTPIGIFYAGQDSWLDPQGSLSDL